MSLSKTLFLLVARARMLFLCVFAQFFTEAVDDVVAFEQLLSIYCVPFCLFILSHVLSHGPLR